MKSSDFASLVWLCQFHLGRNNLSSLFSRYFSSMTSLQRYLGMLSGASIDFVPRTPILMQFAAEFIGSDYAAFASDYHVLARANLECAEYFGFDQMNTMSDPYRETQGFGAEIIYEKKTVPHCKQHPLESSTDLDHLPRPNPLTAQRMRDRIDAVHTFHLECR